MLPLWWLFPAQGEARASYECVAWRGVQQRLPVSGGKPCFQPPQSYYPAGALVLGAVDVAGRRVDKRGDEGPGERFGPVLFFRADAWRFWVVVGVAAGRGCSDSSSESSSGISTACLP